MVRIGRSRLPPEVIRCLATSGIIVTSDPVRDRMAPLTRSMSAVTRSISLSIEASPWLSNGTTTAKIFTPDGAGQSKHRNGMLGRQGRSDAGGALSACAGVGNAGSARDWHRSRSKDRQGEMRQVVELAGEQSAPAAGSRRRIAVLVPCYNEEAAIARVVEDFRAELPDAVVYVYDNNSTDRTAEIARAAGATVRREPRQGKGHVVRRMFADVEADIYVLVDGDATYDAPSVHTMIGRLVEGGLDMVVAARRGDEHAYRPGHRFGNQVLTGFVARVFGSPFADILSGYRVFSRRFVKSFPVLSSGFEIETELTVHALNLELPVA